MSFRLLIQDGISKSGQHSNFKLFIITVSVLILIACMLKAKRKKSVLGENYEQRIIDTISKNKIIDRSFLEGLTPEDMKSDIRQEIARLREKYGQTIDLEKMNLLMEELEFENLQKLYQWFFYKG
jgi:hypothetical protein